MTNPENKPVSAGPVIKWGHDTPLGETNWLWKPLIPYESVTLIQGDGGDGKTTMILTIAAMVSRGVKPPTLFQGKLCPSESCPPVTTFYLTSEDEIADTTLRRFIRAGGDTTRFAYSAELQHHMTLREDELRSAIAQTGCRLLIIDPLQAFLPEGTHLANVTKMRTVFTMLANLAKTTGVAIVLVGHLNKSGGSKDIHRGFGSAKFMLQADEVADAGGWKFEGDEVSPEDCIWSADSTATRSICRSSTSEDTDSKGDWHTVPTSKFSFGKKNSDEIYIKN